jgi:ArsR family transcriptional regulator
MTQADPSPTSPDWQRYERQAEIVRSLAHPIRLAIADYLRDGERCVCEIAEHVGAERSNVSRHLSTMLRSGVLRTRRQGVMVFYALQTPCVLSFLGCATDVLRLNVERDTAVLSQST